MANKTLSHFHWTFWLPKGRWRPKPSHWRIVQSAVKRRSQRIDSMIRPDGLLSFTPNPPKFAKMGQWISCLVQLFRPIAMHVIATPFRSLQRLLRPFCFSTRLQSFRVLRFRPSKVPGFRIPRLMVVPSGFIVCLQFTGSSGLMVSEAEGHNRNTNVGWPIYSTHIYISIFCKTDRKNATKCWHNQILR